MNKIFINNFPYPSQQIHFQNIKEPNDAFNAIHGFEINPDYKGIKAKLASEIIPCLLIYDKICITIKSILDITQVFGITDSIVFIREGCFEIVDDSGLAMLLKQNEVGYETWFPCDYAPQGSKGDAFEVIEKKMASRVNYDKDKVKALFLNVENNIHRIDNIADISLKIRRELDYDLNNTNLINALKVSSGSKKSIKIEDVYSVLRVLHLNKSLIYSNTIDANSMLVDGGIQDLLNNKVTPSLRERSNNSKELLNFKEILSNKGIPDLSLLYAKGIISADEIVAIRENINGIKFREWFHSDNYRKEDLYSILQQENTVNQKLSKFIRWVMPNCIGLSNPVAGIATSFVESYIVDKILKGWHPNIFLDNILKREIDKKIRSYSQEVKEKNIRSKFPNISRKSLCPCGSGKKFKRCCGKIH